MRKIDLKPYPVRMFDAEGKQTQIPYNIRDSIVSILLASGPATTQRLGPAELLKHNAIGEKILDAKDDELLLEEDEYQRLKRAFDAFTGYGRAEVEMVRRILEAPEVEVETKQMTARKEKK